MTKQFKIGETVFNFKGLKGEISAFEQELHHLTHIKSYKMERSGIIGGEEPIRETVFFIMFGQEPLREPEQFEIKKAAFLAKLNNAVITIADLPGIRKEIKEIFNAHVSLDDKSVTPEQHQQELIERNKLHAEINEKQAEEKRLRGIRAEEVKKEYPHLLTSKELSSRILGTKNIRIELEKEFPGQKFSVTSETFAGGDSIDIRWEDGPTSDQVKKITGKYNEGSFDGMNDIYNYSYDPFNDIFGGAKYVNASRKVTHERFIEIGKEMNLIVTFEDWKMTVTNENGESAEGFERMISDAVQNTSFYVKPEKIETSSIGSEEINGITIQENVEKDGVEIKFQAKPQPEVLSKLKSNGFRWNRRTGVWYKKRSQNALIFAQSLRGKTNGNGNHNEDGLMTQEYQNFENSLEIESQQERY